MYNLVNKKQNLSRKPKTNFSHRYTIFKLTPSTAVNTTFTKVIETRKKTRSDNHFRSNDAMQNPFQSNLNKYFFKQAVIGDKGKKKNNYFFVISDFSP